MRHRIRFDFRVEGVRFRPTLPWAPTEGNLRRAHAYLARIKAQVEAGTFCFADAFPHYRGRRGRTSPAPGKQIVCCYSVNPDPPTGAASRPPADPRGWDWAANWALAPRVFGASL